MKSVVVLVVVLAVAASAQQLGGLFDIPGRVVGMFGNSARGLGSAGGRVEGSGRPAEGSVSGGAEGERGPEGQVGGEGEVSGQQGQGQGQEGGQQGGEPQSCIRAAAKCNTNIICGTALRKQLPTCQNPVFPKRCFKCQLATNVLIATPEGQEYMNCECGIDLACRLRRRLQASCLAGIK